MIYGSVCSGIEAATMAWRPLGWKPAFFSEIDAFPCAVLQHRYPQVPLHGDFTTIQDGDYGPINLLVGGTPCQSFSVAGLRKGLDDPRGNLMLGFGALAKRLRPAWLVWENVPGVLSANEGRDFGTFLGMLAELGYGFAYRVLDAQHFGLAQRRKRVFVVGYLGDWRPPAAVLFERHSLSGHPAPSREAEQEVAGAAKGRASGGKQWPSDIASTLDTTMQKYMGLDKQHVNAGCPLFVNHVVHGTQDPCTSNKAFALGRNNGAENAVAVSLRGREGGATAELGGQVAGTLRASSGGGDKPHALHKMAVRRLTPVECEKLQGFPPNFTRIPYRNKTADKCPDGPRYKALGNSMAVPCMAWIGSRIGQVEGILGQDKEALF